MSTNSIADEAHQKYWNEILKKDSKNVKEYIVIRSTDDGISIDHLTKKELLERITPNEGEDGYTYYGQNLNFLDHIPEMDSGWFFATPDNSMVIIKGDIIVPKVKKIVSEYELE